MLIFLSFIILVVLTARLSDTYSDTCSDPARPLPLRWGNSYRQKPGSDWVLDGVGLLIQGVAIPVLQVTVMGYLWAWALPTWESTLTLPWAVQGAISFVGVDYLYYWNHRLLHSQWLWPLHQVHHTVTEMDVLGTSRNTVWSSFFIVYLWVHGLMLYLLDHPSSYLLGISLTAALDLWRHSRFSPPPQHWLCSWLSPWLILPRDHAQHHSTFHQNCNFGANFSLWDKIHGTAEQTTAHHEKLGIPVHLSIMQQLIAPFSRHPAN